MKTNKEQIAAAKELLDYLSVEMESDSFASIVIEYEVEGTVTSEAYRELEKALSKEPIPSGPYEFLENIKIEYKENYKRIAGEIYHNINLTFEGMEKLLIDYLAVQIRKGSNKDVYSILNKTVNRYGMSKNYADIFLDIGIANEESNIIEEAFAENNINIYEVIPMLSELKKTTDIQNIYEDFSINQIKKNSKRLIKRKKILKKIIKRFLRSSNVNQSIGTEERLLLDITSFTVKRKDLEVIESKPLPKFDCTTDDMNQIIMDNAGIANSEEEINRMINSEYLLELEGCQGENLGTFMLDVQYEYYKKLVLEFLNSNAGLRKKLNKMNLKSFKISDVLIQESNKENKYTPERRPNVEKYKLTKMKIGKENLIGIFTKGQNKMEINLDFILGTVDYIIPNNEFTYEFLKDFEIQKEE